MYSSKPIATQTALVKPDSQNKYKRFGHGKDCREERGSKGGEEGGKSREVSVNTMHHTHA